MKYCKASVKINFLFFNRLITTEISTMDHEDFESSCLMDGDVIVECTIVNNSDVREGNYIKKYSRYPTCCRR